MRNRPHNKSEEQIKEENDKERNERVCRQCRVGLYKPHHEHPTKYRKCEVCGHTIKILKS